MFEFFNFSDTLGLILLPILWGATALSTGSTMFSMEHAFADLPGEEGYTENFPDPFSEISDIHTPAAVSVDVLGVSMGGGADQIFGTSVVKTGGSFQGIPWNRFSAAVPEPTAEGENTKPDEETMKADEAARTCAASGILAPPESTKIQPPKDKRTGKSTNKIQCA